MDTGAYYSPYDAIPTPFNAGNGYEVPNVATLILNYKHDRFAITPTIRWDDGSNYGSPLVWPGYVPQSCAAQPSATPTTPGVSCPGSATQGAIFLPDPYTGRFDSLGSLRDPSELSLNLQASYDVTRAFDYGQRREPVSPMLPARLRVGQFAHVQLLEPAVEHLGPSRQLPHASTGASRLSVRYVLRHHGSRRVLGRAAL